MRYSRTSIRAATFLRARARSISNIGEIRVTSCFQARRETAIVTVAGKAVEHVLAEQGAHVVCRARTVADVGAVANKLEATCSIKALTVSWSVTEEVQLIDFVDKTLENFRNMQAVIGRAIQTVLNQGET